MIILGLWDGHNASACLLADGRLVAAMAEERLTRVKMQRGFPFGSARAVMELAGVAPAQVEVVALAGRYGRAPLRLLSKAYSKLPAGKGPLELPQRLYRHYENGLAWLPLVRDLEARLSGSVLRMALDALEIPRNTLVRLVDHHAAHAHSAASMLEGDGLVVTMDGYGDGLCASAYLRSGDSLSLVESRPYLSSVAVTYGSVCQTLGFKEGDEGKVTALAAHGDPGRWKAFFERKLGVHRKGASGIAAQLQAAFAGGPLSPAEMVLVSRGKPEEVAAALQRVCEDSVVAFIARLPGTEPDCGFAQLPTADCLLPTGPFRHGTVPLALAGGLFANVLINRRIVRAFPDRKVAVFPAMGDQGLSVGAAAMTWYERSGSHVALDGVFLGRSADTSVIEAAAWDLGLPLSRPLHAHLAAAQALADGKTVALVTGREEFGPRALGNRSLLFPATSSAFADKVQTMLGRNRIMPFAPVCRAEEIDSCFVSPFPWSDREDRGLGYMTFAVDAAPGVGAEYPAAVHMDGTARVQAVTRKAHPLLHRIIETYQDLTGHKLLINTSFNVHGEPIVHGLTDAMDTFVRSGVDLMLLGEHLVHRPEVRP